MNAGAVTRYRVVHRTTYEYSAPMSDGYSLAYLLPRDTSNQTVERVDVTVDPPPDELARRTDLFGNRVVQLGIHHQHEALTVTAESDVTVGPAQVHGSGPPWERVVDAVTRVRGDEALDVRPFAGGVRMVTEDSDRDDVREIAEAAFLPERPVIDAARALCHDIYTTFDYDRTFTEVSTPLTTVLKARRGVCQDFAHVAISALRHLGLAARYVSGYLASVPQRGSPQPVGADASHAWCSLWVPDAGWVDFDPTNDRLPADRHITVAWGRDYGDVAPIRGIVIGPQASQTLVVAVDVTER